MKDGDKRLTCVPSGNVLVALLVCFSSACTGPNDAAPAGPADAASRDAGAPPRCDKLTVDPARTQAALDALVRDQGVAGVQVYLSLCGKSWSGASGLADISTKRRLEAGALFRGGSTTKTFTAVAVLSLARDGLLSLEDPISRWVPNVPRGSEITVRMVLSNTSGLFNYTDDPVFRASFVNPTRTWTPEELVGVAVRNPALNAPGAGFHYSNTNFVIAAMIAEKVSNSSYAALVRKAVFAPLGLASSFLPPAETLPDGLARGYTWGIKGDGTFDEGYTVGPRIDATFLFDYSHGWGTGNLVTTGKDETTFIRALRRGQLLPNEWLMQMKPTDQSPEYYGGSRYGLGLMRFPTPLGFAYGHGGQTFGYLTYMLDIPDVDLTYVISINDDRGSATTLGVASENIVRSMLPE